MFRRITLLIPLLMILTMSGCVCFPCGGGWHGDHRYHHDGYYRR